MGAELLEQLASLRLVDDLLVLGTRNRENSGVAKPVVVDDFRSGVEVRGSDLADVERAPFEHSSVEVAQPKLPTAQSSSWCRVLLYELDSRFKLSLDLLISLTAVCCVLRLLDAD